ncbi:MAG: YqjD family protein [Zoogloeaceae bacterium]|nr:YqjD family protein [Zoogloeaceae bacterium]
MSEMTEVNKQKLISDLKVVVTDAEEILKATAGQAGEKMADLRAKLQDRLASARENLADAQAAMVERTKQVARATDDYVHDNPWRSVGIAAGIGFFVGLLIGRR